MELTIKWNQPLRGKGQCKSIQKLPPKRPAWHSEQTYLVLNRLCQTTPQRLEAMNPNISEGGVYIKPNRFSLIFQRGPKSVPFPKRVTLAPFINVPTPIRTATPDFTWPWNTKWLSVVSAGCFVRRGNTWSTISKTITCVTQVHVRNVKRRCLDTSSPWPGTASTNTAFSFARSAQTDQFFVSSIPTRHTSQNTIPSHSQRYLAKK